MRIRYATPKDAATIVKINVNGWKTAYRDIFPVEFLSNLSLDVERTTQEIHKQPKNYLVATSETGVILGFCHFGENRWDQFKTCDCELTAIYVDSSAQGNGIGNDLIKEAAKELASRGKQKMLINVLEQNTNARLFYQHLGAEIIGNKDFILKEVTYPQLTLALDIAK